MSDQALREDRDGVAIVTFNRPDKLNAISRAMTAVLSQAVEDLRDRSDLRVLLIRSTGRFFTAGIDVSETPLAETDNPLELSEMRRNYRRNLHVIFDEMEAVEKPIVMAVHATCLGAGVELGGAADFRLAAESARFGLPEVNLGVLAGSGGISRFTRLCGVGWSKWLNMAGEQIDARTAQMAGYIQAVHPDETFEEEVWAFCQRLAQRPLESQAAAKVAIELCKDLDKASGRNVERALNAPLMLRDNTALVEQAMERARKS